MDEDRPINQFFGFLKLIGVLILIILSGVALVVGLSWYLSPEQPGAVFGIATGPVKQLPAYVPEPLPAPVQADQFDGDLAMAQDDYREAKAELEAALDSREGPPPILEEELGVVEGAIIEIVSALSLNPNSERLRHTLLGTYQRQVELLRKTIEVAEEQSASGAPDPAI